MPPSATRARSTAIGIPEELVAERTVKFRLPNIYREIGVANRTEAALFARLHGLLDDAERHVA